MNTVRDNCSLCHSRESGNPGSKISKWIPVYRQAGPGQARG